MTDEGMIDGNLKSVFRSTFFYSFGTWMANFLIPIIAYDFLNASGTEVGLIIAVVSLGSIAIAPITGRLATPDRRRRVMASGGIIVAIGYSLALFAIGFKSISLLILIGGFWGIGAGVYMVSNDAEISDGAKGRNRSEAFGQRQAILSQGRIAGTIIGFGILFLIDINVLFLLYTFVTSLSAFVLFQTSQFESMEKEDREILDAQRVASSGAIILILAVSIDAFISGILSPFIQLFVIDHFSNNIVHIAVVYFPGAFIIAIIGRKLGILADKSNKIILVSLSCAISSISILSLVYIRELIISLEVALLLVATLFVIGRVTVTLSYTTITSVYGDAFQGHAGKGFGILEASMGLSSFIAPVIGGLLWDYVGHSAPFILVGISGFFVIPIYAIGIRKHLRK